MRHPNHIPWVVAEKPLEGTFIPAGGNETPPSVVTEGYLEQLSGGSSDCLSVRAMWEVWRDLNFILHLGNEVAPSPSSSRVMSEEAWQTEDLSYTRESQNTIPKISRFPQKKSLIMQNPGISQLE